MFLEEIPNDICCVDLVGSRSHHTFRQQASAVGPGVAEAIDSNIHHLRTIAAGAKGFGADTAYVGDAGRRHWAIKRFGPFQN